MGVGESGSQRLEDEQERGVGQEGGQRWAELGRKRSDKACPWWQQALEDMFLLYLPGEE